jgi:hypothetical protein
VPGRCGGRCQGVLGLRLTRLACGKLAGSLPARMRENEWAVARAAAPRKLGVPRGCCAKLEAIGWLSHTLLVSTPASEESHEASWCAFD